MGGLINRTLGGGSRMLLGWGAPFGAWGESFLSFFFFLSEEYSCYHNVTCWKCLACHISLATRISNKRPGATNICNKIYARRNSLPMNGTAICFSKCFLILWTTFSIHDKSQCADYHINDFLCNLGSTMQRKLVFIHYNNMMSTNLLPLYWC